MGINDLKKYLRPDDFYLIKHELREYNINWEEVISYIDSLDLTAIRNKSPYIRKTIMNEITLNHRWIKEISIDNRPQFLFHEYWAKYPLEVNEYTKYMYEQLIDYIYADGCSLEELKQTTDLIPTLVKTTDEAYKMLKRTYLIKKFGVNLMAFERAEKENFEKWQKLLEELDGIK